VIDYYVILRDTHPYSIGAEDSLAATTDTFYVDSTAAVGNTSVNHYYAIVAVDEGGNKSAPSRVVGEFDKDLSDVK
jgi:fibronectin type 3 domain-containing protein